MAIKFRSVRNAGKLSELVRNQLEKAILSGEVKVNEQLPTEANLGASFGVSRTVIREALQRLEAQGLVQSRIGSGSYVAPYPMDQVKTAMGRFAALNQQADTFLNLLDLRIVIETETCGRLAERHDADAISDLRTILGQMAQSREDLVQFAKADMDFHIRIAQASGNPFFPTILESLKGIGQAFSLATYESRAIIERTRRDHRAILQAVIDGDGETSRRRMHDHIAFSKTHYLELQARLESADSGS
jgi:GntR family transcriptional repressor for pyruvate dehydrogenase complex